MPSATTSMSTAEFCSRASRAHQAAVVALSDGQACELALQRCMSTDVRRCLQPGRTTGLETVLAAKIICEPKGFAFRTLKAAVWVPVWAAFRLRVRVSDRGEMSVYTHCTSPRHHHTGARPRRGRKGWKRRPFPLTHSPSISVIAIITLSLNSTAPKRKEDGIPGHCIHVRSVRQFVSQIIVHRQEA